MLSRSLLGASLAILISALPGCMSDPPSGDAAASANEGRAGDSSRSPSGDAPKGDGPTKGASPGDAPTGDAVPGSEALPAAAQAEANDAELPVAVTPDAWMALTPELVGKKFHDIAIPGTHDSGTYSLLSIYSRPVNDAFASDDPGLAAKAGQFAFASEPWAKAQRTTLGQQLAAGARYLDLRPCAEADGTLRICHALYGPLMSDLLQDIANFVHQHPKEIVLVSMQSFSGFSDGDHQKLRALIDEKLGPHVLDWGAGEFRPTMTLDEIWAHPGKSVVIIHSKPSQAASSYMPASEIPDLFEQEWARKEKKASLENARTLAFSDELWVLSGQATPDEAGKLIGLSMAPGSSYPASLEELADATNPELMQWLTYDWLSEYQQRKFNIVSVDFFDKTCLFPVTQMRNGVKNVSFTGCQIGETSWADWRVGPYSRGAGMKLQCEIGKELVGGLCYVPCRAGYESPLLFPYVCGRTCPSGYRDDGLTCFRDAKIISADNSACPAYDVCGLTFASGCSTCPSGAGYANDGCTCRRDPHMITKTRYERGAGTVPQSCPAGTVRDGALCYPACKSGFTGVGPLCVP